nr:retrovirus-related Pol polyprotein from transposon TNT 1-94 [Tanacetum cinerariifolium]
MHNMGNTIGELHVLLVEYEKGKGKGKGKGNDKSYIPKPKNPIPFDKEHPVKDDTCHHCKEVGHWKRNCPAYFAELIKKKKQVGTASSSDVFTIEIFSFPNKSWVYDTGCSTQICNTKQGLRGEIKLKQGALYLFMGNGIYAQVKAIGSYDLVLPSGLVICLENCHYAPSITRGVVSVSHLVDNGFIQCFTDYEISVSKNNVRYSNAILDDYSRYDYMYLLKHKHEVFEMFKVFKNEVENQLGKTIKSLRSDRGGEYISQEFKAYQKCYGIVHQLTPPYTPQHNGVSKRRNRALLDMVRSYMNLTTLPLSFWDYALETATRVLNIVPTKKGCEALVKRDTPDKLQQRSVKCIFIEYPKKTMGYYFYFLPENKIVVARYAEFLEKKLVSQEVSRSAKELKEIQDENRSPSENNSEILMEVEGFKPPQKEVVPVHRSARTHREPDRLSLNVKVQEHSLGDLNEPNNYKVALLDLESGKWVDAMNAKMQSMKENHVWCLVDLLPNCKTVGSKWFFFKTDIKGIVHTYKARLVAKGYTQTYGVDYEETFSPVADIRAIRILISIATFYDYEIWQMDVKIDFLNGYLDEDIYMVQPEDFIDPKQPIKRFEIDNSKRGNIPTQERVDLNKTQGASTLEEVKRMQNVPYASVVGSIMYAVRCTRPDVAFT